MFGLSVISNSLHQMIQSFSVQKYPGGKKMNTISSKRIFNQTVQAATSILVVLVMVFSALALDTTPVQAASTYWVNNTVTCSDANPGTNPAAPLCTIGRGADLATTAGDIVRVVAGTYPESVYPAASGTSTFPITFLVDPGVTVTVTGNPAAVPGTGFGFGISGRSYVVVDGFHFTGTKANAIFVTESHHITIRNNHVSLSGDPANPALHVEGIVLKNADNSTVSNNISNNNTCYGIRLLEGSDNNTINNNKVYGNASAVISDAAGIEMYGSSYNTIKNNIVYGNEDSGIDMYIMTAAPYTQSTYNVVVGNLVYGNGDHGIDNNNSPYNTVVGNTVHGNGTAGINFEGEVGKGSHHGTIMNNIMSGNGLTPPSYSFGGNLRVDIPSNSGTVANYNLYFKEGVQSVQILWNDNIPYATLADFRAAVGGQEVNGSEGNPQFVSQVPNILRTETPRNGYVIPVVVGDYHLKYTSSAIDNAYSGAANEPTTDIAGSPRFDALWVTNNAYGGPRAYDDRGAYEMQQPTCYVLTINSGVHGTTPTATPLKSIPCTTNGQYLAGEVIALSGAVPESSDYAITGWTGTDNNASTSGSNTVTMPAGPRTSGVTYTAVYHPPVITEGDAPIAVGMSEDNPASFVLTLHATDLVSPSLTWSISTAAIHGNATASGTGSSKVIGYSPAANYNGTDSFVVKVSDGNPAWDDTITVNVNIAPVNDAPVCSGVTLTVAEDTPGDVTPSCTDVDLDTIVPVSVSVPPHGVAYFLSGLIHYIPNSNYSGPDSFTYKMSDGTTESNSASVAVTVTGINDAPVITEGASTSVTMSEDGAPTPFNLTLHATDAEADPITWSVLTQALHGTASLPAGTGTSKVISYTPTANYFGPDSFVVRVTDGIGGSNSITVNVTIDPINDAPVITEGVSIPVIMSEDGSPVPFSLTLTATDVESNIITWSISTPAGHGSASASGAGSSKVISYTPTANFFGSDIFVVSISDGNGGSDTITVNVTINAVDDAPVITEGASTFVTMSEDSSPTAFSLTLNASDIDNTGSQLTWSISSQASHGTATATGTGLSKSIGYTPVANHNGSDSFIVQVSDGTLADTITVNVTIDPRNDAPVCGDVPLVISQDTSGSVVPGCSDVDGDSLSFSIVSNATHGTATAGTNILNYTPNTAYVGLDTFTYRANDGLVNSNISAVNVTVNHVNHAPVIAEGATTAVTMSEDGSPLAFSLNLNATDTDGDTLTWSISSVASHGTASASGTGSPKAIGYSPNANFNGSDSFIVMVSDGNGGSDTITVNLTINPVNDAPVCSALPLATAEDTMGEISPSCTDVDTGDVLTYSIVGSASHGATSVVSGKLRYTPTANYNGGDSFTYKANDTHVDSNTATVTVTVSAVNDAPVCSALPLATAEDTMGEISPSCTDVDTGDVLTYSIVGSASHGATSVVSGKLRYTPTANYNGGDSFTYKANDTHVDSNTATVTVTVSAVNDAPVCSALPLATAEDTMGEISPSCTDVDTGDVLTYSIVGSASHGATSVVSGKLRYTPTANYNGGDSFTYKANDTHVDSNTATVTVTVSAVNDAPVCSALPLATAEDTMGEISPSCTDVDTGDVLTYSIVGSASHGATSVVSGKLRYTPTANYNGGDSFTYKANDTHVDSNTATVTVTVSAVNDLPVITEGISANVNMSENGAPVAFALTLNATDVDADTITWSISTPALHGIASALGPGLSKGIGYVPDTNFSGGDTFTVQVSDGNGGLDTITVNVTISEVIRTISGNAGVADAKLSYFDRIAKEVNADGTGAYTLPVHYNWSGTVTPSKLGYTFSPASNEYSDVTVNQSGQNYTASEIVFTISGNAGAAGARISYPGGFATADGSGNYSFGISYGWDGEVTPFLAGFTFFPMSKIYTDVLENKTGENFEVRTPSDLHKVPSTRPSFGWPVEPGYSQYQIQVSTYSNFQSNLLDKTTSIPSYLPSADLPTGKYLYWRIRGLLGPSAGSWSPTWSFIIPPVILNAPVLISPVSGLLTNNNDVSFSWNTVLGGTKYELQVSKSSSFATTERDFIDLLPADPLSLSMVYDAIDLPDGKFYWRTRAFNTLNVAGKWSAIRNLTVDTVAPVPPVLKLPAADGTAIGTPAYSWNSSSGAYRYQYGYDAVSCANPGYKSGELSVTSHKPPTQAVGLWYWCVRVRDAANNWSSWSPTRKITINPTTPVAPALNAPLIPTSRIQNAPGLAGPA